MTRSTPRRTFIKTSGASVAAAVDVGTVSAGSGDDTEWRTRETPTGNTLYDIAWTSDEVYPVGVGGIVFQRPVAGYEKILDCGPTGNGNDLYGADVTVDGARPWFVGASGAIEEYDVNSGDLTDHSAPNDVTNNFNDVAVTPEADEADVYVAGDSGRVSPSFENGATGT